MSNEVTFFFHLYLFCRITIIVLVVFVSLRHLAMLHPVVWSAVKGSSSTTLTTSAWRSFGKPERILSVDWSSITSGLAGIKHGGRHGGAAVREKIERSSAFVIVIGGDWVRPADHVRVLPPSRRPECEPGQLWMHVTTFLFSSTEVLLHHRIEEYYSFSLRLDETCSSGFKK